MIEHYKNLSLESLFYINDEGLVCQEEWRDIPDYVGMYQISTLGRLKSLERFRFHKKRGKELIKLRILKQTRFSKSRLFVGLWKDKVKKLKSISLIMGEVFFNHKYDHSKQEMVDHKNNNPLDNRLENLQIITHRKNSSKDKKPKTGYTGVYKQKNKFRVSIDFNNKRYNLGSFYSAKKASEIYVEAVKLIENKESFSHLINPPKSEPNKFWSKITEKEVLEIRTIGGTNYLATFTTNLTTSANNFVTSHATTLLALGITVTASSGVLTFVAATATFPTITAANVSGDLSATIASVSAIATTGLPIATIESYTKGSFVVRVTNVGTSALNKFAKIHYRIVHN